MDLLRGWAMFGVLWSSLNDWYGARDPVTAFDRGLAWAANWILAHGDWLQVAHVRFAASLDWYGRWGLMLYSAVLGSFLVGFWAVKSGFLTRVMRDPRVMRRMLYWAGGVALVCYASDIWFRDLLPHASLSAGPSNPRFWIPGNTTNALAGWTTEASSLTYAALLLLAWQTARGPRLLRPLAATGRMALTTYLVQSVVCTLLFCGYGFGLFGQLTHTGMFALTTILFGLQMAASTWWLRRFEFGPAEWLWRPMTYGSAGGMLAAGSAVPDAGRA